MEAESKEKTDVKDIKVEVKNENAEIKKEEQPSKEETAEKKSQVLKKSSLQSIGSIQDRFFRIQNTDLMDFFKNSGTEFGIGKFMNNNNNNETFDFDMWRKSSQAAGLFGETVELPGDKGMINGQMLQSNEIGLFINNDLEKSKMFDHHSPGLSNLFRDSIAASPFTPQGTFNGSSFKNFRQEWLPQEENEEKNE